MSERGWPMVDISQLWLFSTFEFYVCVRERGRDALKNANDAWLSLVKNEVVNLEIAVDERAAVSRLLVLVGEKSHEIGEMRQRPDSHAGLDVAHSSLGITHRLPSGHLPIIKPRRLPKRLEANRARVDAVQLGEGAHGVGPDGEAVVGQDGRDDGVLEDAAVKELHDVEGGAEHGGVLAEAVGARDRDVGVLEGVDDAVLALDLVRRLGE